MRSFSIFVLSLIMASSFSSAQLFGGINETHTSCGELQQLQSCTANIFSFLIRKQPINSTCCDTVLNIANECSSDRMPIWFLKSQKYCAIVNITQSTPTVPQTPKKTPTSLNFTTPPSVGGFKLTCLQELRRLTPCISDIKAFMRTNSSINSTCCTAILDVGNQCHWGSWPLWFAQTQNYCKKH